MSDKVMEVSGYLLFGLALVLTLAAVIAHPVLLLFWVAASFLLAAGMAVIGR